MLMKVYSKGQVVIPSGIRKELSIQVGDVLDVQVNTEHNSIEIFPVHTLVSETLGGSLAEYAIGKPFPSEEEIAQSIASGMTNEDESD